MFVGAFASLLEPINSRPSPPPTSGVLAPTRPPLCVDTSSLASLTRWLAFVAGACFRCGPPRVACAVSRSIRWTSPRIYPLDLSVGSFLDMSVGFVRWIFPADQRQPAERLSHTLSPRFEEAAWTEAVPPSRRGVVVDPTHPHLPLPARRQAGPTSPSLAYPLPRAPPASGTAGVGSFGPPSYSALFNCS